MAWTGGQVGQRSEQRTSRAEVYSKRRTEQKAGRGLGRRADRGGGGSEQRTSRGEVYSKQEDRTKSMGKGWTGGQIGERSRCKQEDR
jgi:hypothetical protein